MYICDKESAFSTYIANWLTNTKWNLNILNGSTNTPFLDFSLINPNKNYFKAEIIYYKLS